MKKNITMLFTICSLIVAMSTAAYAAPDKESSSEVTAETQIETEISAPSDPAQNKDKKEKAGTETAVKLSEEEALTAALKDAGERETAITVSKNKLAEKELANGETIMVYSIRFSTDTTTYKYYIDANTGAILYKKTEFCAADFILKNNNSKADTEGNLHTDTQESEKHSRQYKQGD